MKNKKKRKIHNTIRDATENDIKNYNAPKNTKYKIVFSSPQGKTNITKKFQGAQYFATKKEAENALNERLNLTQKLKEKKSKSMINNKIAVGNSGNVESLIKIQNERTNLYNQKINKGVKLLNKGHTVMEAQKIIIEEFNLDISEDSRTLLPWMSKARDKALK